MLGALAAFACAPPDDSGLFGSGNADAETQEGSAGSKHTLSDSGWPDSGTGASTADASDDCELRSWCRDADGDGWGALAELVESCVAPGDDWIEAEAGKCTDCFGQSKLVHPGSTHCLTKGYVVQDENGALPSFDADCDGVESECGSKAAANCSGAAGLCGGSGYLPAGPGENPYCGSTAHRSCSGLGCSASESQTDPLGCR